MEDNDIEKTDISRAYRFGKLAIIQWRWVCISIDGGLMDDGIELIGGDTRTDMGRRKVKDLSS